MVLNKHEKKYKRFLALQRENDQIRKAKRSLPWTEVKPYQDGWFLQIEFREDIKRRADYPYLRMVLDLVQIKGRTKEPKLVSKLRKMKGLDDVYTLFRLSYGYYEYLSKAVGGHIKTSDMWYYHSSTPPVLGRTFRDKYDKLPIAAQRWMEKVTETTKYYGEMSWYVSTIPRYFFIVKARPAFVTHEKDIDPELDRREAEVGKELRLLGWDFYTNCTYGKYNHHLEIRRRRAHDRAVMRKLEKEEIEDFEHLRKNINYD